MDSLDVFIIPASILYIFEFSIVYIPQIVDEYCTDYIDKLYIIYKFVGKIGHFNQLGPTITNISVPLFV